jgi:hypothetical protein
MAEARSTAEMVQFVVLGLPGDDRLQNVGPIGERFDTLGSQICGKVLVSVNTGRRQTVSAAARDVQTGVSSALGSS